MSSTVRAALMSCDALASSCSAGPAGLAGLAGLVGSATGAAAVEIDSSEGSE
jgi:hypothetical protein